MLYGQPGDNRRKHQAIKRLKNYFRYHFNQRINDNYAIKFFRSAQGGVRYIDWSLALDQTYDMPQFIQHWMDRPPSPPPPEFGRRDE